MRMAELDRAGLEHAAIGARGFCQRFAHLESRIVGQKGARQQDGGRGAFALHHHAARGAHHVVRVLAQNAPAAFGDFRHVGAQIHLGKQDERGWIVGIERPTALGDQGGIAVARGRPALAPAGAAGQRQRKAFTRKPVDPLQRFGERPGSPLGVVQLSRVVVEADAKQRDCRHASG